MMTSEHLKLIVLLCLSSCVNLATIALTVLKLHEGGGGGGPRRLKKRGLTRVKQQHLGLNNRT